MHRVIISLVVMMSFLGLDFTPGKTASSLTYTTATLAPVWTTGIISDIVGLAAAICPSVIASALREAISF